jgi:hypothetical protein
VDDEGNVDQGVGELVRKGGPFIRAVDLRAPTSRIGRSLVSYLPVCDCAGRKLLALVEKLRTEESIRSPSS